MAEPIRTGMVGFVGKHNNIASCLLFNFLFYPEGKAFEVRPRIQDIHEFLGMHRVVSNHHMPEAAIAKTVSERFPRSFLRLYVDVEGVDKVSLSPNIKAHYRPLSCSLMFFAKTMAEILPDQYSRFKDRKNYIWKIAEVALEENLQTCTVERVIKENDRIRITDVEIVNDIPLPPAFFPKEP